MQRKFDPEFLNRIDRSLHYQAVQHDVLPRLVEIELEPILALYFLNQPEQFSLHLDCVDG
jgi:ATP-dependent Clp protease ATP-binding subunit ClpA